MFLIFFLKIFFFSRDLHAGAAPATSILCKRHPHLPRAGNHWWDYYTVVRTCRHPPITRANRSGYLSDDLGRRSCAVSGQSGRGHKVTKRFWILAPWLLLPDIAKAQTTHVPRLARPSGGAN